MVAHWLPHPFHVGGSPTLERREPNHRRLTRGHIGYITLQITAGVGLEVAHIWATSLVPFLSNTNT